MRILHACEFYPPSVGGAQEVMRQVSEHLVQLGHEVTVATSRLPGRSSVEQSGVQIAEFDVLGNLALGLKGDVAGYRKYIANGSFDVILTYAAQQWTTDALIPILSELEAPVVLAPCGFSGLNDPRYTEYFMGLREVLPLFDALVCHSPTYQDARFVADVGAPDQALKVIPNGADEREFGDLPRAGAFRELLGVRPGDPLAITVGGHTGLKGHAEAMAAFSRCSSMQGGTLAVIANQPTGSGCALGCRQRARVRNLANRDRRIVVIDPPRDLVVQAYADADLFVFCSQVECSPLVLFEAMAAGLPFVSLDVGNAREIAEWGACGLIVPSEISKKGRTAAKTRDVAMAIDHLMADDRKRAGMSMSGRASWEERFTWASLAEKYEELYFGLAT